MRCLLGRLVMTSDVDVHHEMLRFSWKIVLQDGKTMLEGIDFGELDESGRIRRIVGFFGVLKTKPE